MDSRRTPRGVLARHTSDDLERLAIDVAPAVARAEAPVEPEPGAMPAHHGFRLDHNERIHPARPEAPQRHPEQAVEVVEARPGVLAFENGELLAQGEYLQAKIMARPNEGSQVQEECEHAIFALQVSAGVAWGAGRSSCCSAAAT